MSKIEDIQKQNCSAVNKLVLAIATAINERLKKDIFRYEDIVNQNFIREAGHQDTYRINDFLLHEDDAIKTSKQILSDIYKQIEDYCKKVILNINVVNNMDSGALVIQVENKDLYSIYDKTKEHIAVRNVGRNVRRRESGLARTMLHRYNYFFRLASNKPYQAEQSNKPHQTAVDLLCTPEFCGTLPIPVKYDVHIFAPNPNIEENSVSPMVAECVADYICEISDNLIECCCVTMETIIKTFKHKASLSEEEEKIVWKILQVMIDDEQIHRAL